MSERLEPEHSFSWLSSSLQACVDPGTKDQLHTVEVEGQDSEGQKVKAVLAALKPSTLPSVRFFFFICKVALLNVSVLLHCHESTFYNDPPDL